MVLGGRTCAKAAGQGVEEKRAIRPRNGEAIRRPRRRPIAFLLQRPISIG